MKALIVAAGKGRAVLPLWRDCPKPMLRIVDTPVLELLISRLRDNGINQIMISTSDKTGSIENHFGDGRRFGVEIAWSFEGYQQEGQLMAMPHGAAGAIRKIQQQSGFFDETFLVLRGDAVIDMDFAELVAMHHRNMALATIALADIPAGSVGHNDVVVQSETGMIAGFQRPASVTDAARCLVSTGVYVFEPQVIGCIGRELPIELDTHLLPSLVREGLPVYGARLPLEWMHINTVSEYYQSCQQALAGKVPGFVQPGREVAAGLRVGLNVNLNPRRCEISGPVVIGGGARIGDGAKIIGPCYIGAGAVIAGGAQIEKSIVLPHARIGAEAHLRAMVTDGAFCMTADGHVIDLAVANMQWIIGDARMHDTTIQQAEQRFLDSIH